MPFLADLSVSKTHFTDKPAFSSGLSVNFWPLYWEFTDKRRFSEHLSVKPGPKRLNFYGQPAIFAHFVRNRYFSDRPFTDSMLIFIDLSVNGSDFVKYSTRSISAPSSQSNLPPSSFWRLSCIRKKTGSDLRLIANHPVFQFEAWFFPSLFRLDIIKDSINYESRLFLSKSKHFLHFSSIY